MSNFPEIETMNAQRDWLNKHVGIGMPDDIRTDVAFASLSYFCPDSMTQEECIKAIKHMKEIRERIEKYQKSKGFPTERSLVAGINHKPKI